MAFGQGRYPQALEMLYAESYILENIEASIHAERLVRARSWLRKCDRELCDEEAAVMYSEERATLKEENKAKTKQHAKKEYLETVKLQRKLYAAV